MKPLVIYHKDCADGAGAALAAWLKLSGDAEYRPAQCGDPAPTAEEIAGRDVFILDFSWPRAEVLRMAGQCARLVLLDHHKTALEELSGLKVSAPHRLVIDLERSGATLSYGFFFPDDTVPALFRYLQDRDLWAWKLPLSREVNAGLQALPFWKDFRVFAIYALRQFDTVESFLVGAPGRQLMHEGRGILRWQESQVKAAADRAREVKVFACRGAAVASSVFQSEIGHELIQRGHELALIYFLSNDGKVVVSLRSGPTLDCSAIAKSFPGGGGHARAAGFTLPDARVLFPWSVCACPDRARCLVHPPEVP